MVSVLVVVEPHEVRAPAPVERGAAQGVGGGRAVIQHDSVHYLGRQSHLIYTVYADNV